MLHVQTTWWRFLSFARTNHFQTRIPNTRDLTASVGKMSTKEVENQRDTNRYSRHTQHTHIKIISLYYLMKRKTTMADPSPPIDEQDRNFLSRIQSAIKTVEAWDADSGLLAECRGQIPISELVSKKDGATHDDDVLYSGNALFLKRLTRYFKDHVMKWVNNPPCVKCGSDKTEARITRGPQTDEEEQGGASRVEGACCLLPSTLYPLSSVAFSHLSLLRLLSQSIFAPLVRRKPPPFPVITRAESSWKRAAVAVGNSPICLDSTAVRSALKRDMSPISRTTFGWNVTSMAIGSWPTPARD